jgi:hypothetical protein
LQPIEWTFDDERANKFEFPFNFCDKNCGKGKHESFLTMERKMTPFAINCNGSQGEDIELNQDKLKYVIDNIAG